MKAKVINVSFPSESEAELNKWLGENPNVEVVTIHTYSNIRVDYYNSGEHQYISNTYYEYTVTIIYKES